MIIRMGVSPSRVLTMPVLVRWTANRDRATPRKGPNIAPAEGG
jgi:hypothetical protein